MKIKLKNFTPLIITSSVLVIAVIGNIIMANVDINDLPAIDHDIRSTDDAQAAVQTAQAEYDGANSELVRINAELSEKQNTANQLKNQISGLQDGIKDIDEKQGDMKALQERYDKCIAEAKRLSNDWAVYKDMQVYQVDANYDSNSLRYIQNIANIYSSVGDMTGFWGNLLSDSITTSAYSGFDGIIAAVDMMTATANEHLNSASLYISKINSKIDSADTLLTEELSGENLLFEVELFESSYFGKDDLFEEERKSLLRDLEYSHAVLTNVYPVYQMMLSQSDVNTTFLSSLSSQISRISGYIDAIAKPDDTRLTEEELGKITYSVYQLFPVICNVITEPSYVYKGVTLRSDRITYDGFLSAPDKVLIAYKNNSIFVIRTKASKSSKKEYYYSPDGTPLYVIEGIDTVCCSPDGNIVYTNTTEERAQKRIQSANGYFKQFSKR